MGQSHHERTILYSNQDLRSLRVHLVHTEAERSRPVRAVPLTLLEQGTRQAPKQAEGDPGCLLSPAIFTVDFRLHTEYYVVMKQEIVLPERQCNRCDHTWLLRVTHEPARCPKCKSQYWNKARTRARTGADHGSP